jgi:hypothetical protein
LGMDYQIVRDDDCDQLVERVRVEMTAGWEPLGGVCVVKLDDVNVGFYQALVRRRR